MLNFLTFIVSLSTLFSGAVQIEPFDLNHTNVKIENNVLSDLNKSNIDNNYLKLLIPDRSPKTATIVSLDIPWDSGDVIDAVAKEPPPPICTDKEELIDNKCVPLPEPIEEIVEEVGETASRSEVITVPSIIPSDNIVSLLNQIKPMNQIANYTNGSVPTELLCTVPWASSFQVYCPTLEPLKKLNEAYVNEFGKNISFASAYRAGFQNRSFHGWGMAIDLNGSNGLMDFGDREYKWMVVNAPKFGWYHPFWAGVSGSNPEAWHWEFGSWYFDDVSRNYTSEIPPVIIRWIHH